jgi:SAM-dependent methyltransferase
MHCPICSNNNFEQSIVIKQRLINEWGLNSEEVDYINKQQGFHCTNCSSNLRSMTLAHSIFEYFSLKGNFQQIFHTTIGKNKELLEINEAGDLHSIFCSFKNYKFAEYPTVDMQNLPFKDETFDIIVHSDTLEHVKDSAKALKECNRVLKIGGVLFYTIPIIYGRMTMKRAGTSNSYHGSQDEGQGDDYLVWTEYGADFWVEINKAGFNEIRLYSLGDASTIAISAKKSTNKKYLPYPYLSELFQIDKINIKIRNAIKKAKNKYGINR